jgi:tRNA nucleotidyltransferase (CCA-adding enzyme)
MHLILCHTTADFDALGAAVGLTCLLPGSQLVLTGGAHPGVRNFLALYRDEYPIAEAKSIDPHQIQTLSIVDTQQRSRLGKCQTWLDLPQLQTIHVYDHHLAAESDIQALSGKNVQYHLAPVGATTTLIAELLQQQQIELSSAVATVMALGIHVDTGSLTFSNTTPRDASAIAWLLREGADLAAIADYHDQGLSLELQQLLPQSLAQLQTDLIQGYRVSSVMLDTSHFVTGLSSLASELRNITTSDILLLGARHPLSHQAAQLVTIIGRSQVPGVNLSPVFQEYGGGGHPTAAALHGRSIDPTALLTQIRSNIIQQIPAPLTARVMMSSPVRTVRPELTIAEAQRLILRYGHSGLCVTIDTPSNPLVGVISRRDLDLAIHHGFAHAPVKGYMKNNVQTITPTTTIADIQALMVRRDIGRLPVVESGQLVGIVTRTDVLRHRYRLEKQPDQISIDRAAKLSRRESITTPHRTYSHLPARLHPALWQLLQTAAQLAHDRGWHLYLVGGAIRDLILAPASAQLLISDLDLVVDGFNQAADDQAGVELAQALYHRYPAARLDIHGQFQTAALLWHHDPVLDSLCIDIATARTEFYPYPAANPEVAASSIQQDLYRRDFTINALALRLTPPHPGELLDFFGGAADLQARQLRVLHAHSFIEDPTRIYRGIRFAVRLGFTIEPQTIAYIRYAIASGVYQRTLTQNSKAPALQTRLLAELKYILQTDYWLAALAQLQELDALQCLHPELQIAPETLRRLHLIDNLLASPSLAQHPSLHSPWLMRLEVLLLALTPSDRAQVAQQLQLPADSHQRLTTIDQTQAEIAEILPRHLSIGKLVHFLQTYPLNSLLLAAIMLPADQSAVIQQYLTDWSQIKAALTGHDLKELGYKPGIQYKQILDAILEATLDGLITNRSQAIDFLQQHYPQPESR